MIKLIIVFFATCIILSLLYNTLLNLNFKQLQFAAKAVVVMMFSAVVLFLITLLF